ncbi:hypothetical protein INT45_000217 [Circinella minor]|uniref:Uncharacterized protein n=1 Tax=Circinella minor TaxID=1195481 RepID=A0A8H7VNM5_9FUNG|nr:hypothetical protein INT45_000217 [Circinella minor]
MPMPKMKIVGIYAYIPAPPNSGRWMNFKMAEKSGHECSKMIALVHFLTQQQKHIVALDEYMDSKKLQNSLPNLYR